MLLKLVVQNEDYLDQLNDELLQPNFVGASTSKSLHGRPLIAYFGSTGDTGIAPFFAKHREAFGAVNRAHTANRDDRY